MIGDKLKNNLPGILMMLLASTMVATGQFFWKLALGNVNLWLLLGFSVYGIGAVLMIKALQFGELSVLHPIMAFSYVVAFLLAFVFLHETYSVRQVSGIFLIIVGVVLLGTNQQA
jgi:drug/metabolite transporter (DMT)-like permease